MPAVPLLTSVAPVERHRLDERSWVDVTRGWVASPGPIYEDLVERVEFKTSRLWRYERWVEEPRVGAWFTTATLPHPVLRDAQRALQSRYGVTFDGASVIWYRNGRDSVAFHRDRELRFCEDTVIAILTFGQRRPWLLRPRTRRDKWIAPDGGATHDFAPGPGDLLVMGGRCQADWEHAVPKVDVPIGGRVSVQWRWTSRRGRPEVGGSYRAPRNFA
ncbi:MAG TPA: alpha-ketoglutarate-dependent dioxygenase AlkB [Acidimicrobiia bacterium]|nr:alpha-ketoglutarate-dependent dioxygenase AlkB [Acidimicrobiia bacterium]